MYAEFCPPLQPDKNIEIVPNEYSPPTHVSVHLSHVLCECNSS